MTNGLTILIGRQERLMIVVEYSRVLKNSVKTPAEELKRKRNEKVLE